MRPPELLSRVTGLSTPFFGISWIPPVADVEVARKVITFVEARRVLFGTYSDEVPADCAQSVIEIRNFLTEVIGQGHICDKLEKPLRAARRYCNRFLTRVGSSEADVPVGDRDRHLFHHGRWRLQDHYFGEALGELRSGVCLQIAIIAVTNDLDVEDELANVLPEPDTDA